MYLIGRHHFGEGGVQMEELALWKRMGTFYAKTRKKGSRIEVGKWGLL